MGDLKIRITTSGTTIVPYKKKQCPDLERITSMKDFGCKFKRIEVTGYQLSDRFVTYHLPRFYLDNYFPSYEIEYIPPNKFNVISEKLPFDFVGDLELRSDQYSVANPILQDRKHNRWFVHCPQAFGKTIVSVYLICQFRVNTMIMCYSTAILEQWKEKIIKCTNINMKRVLTIDSGKIMDAIMEDKFPVEDYDIYLATPSIITTFAKKHSFDDMNTLFQKMKIGLKIYDEAHRNLGNMIKIDASTSVKYTLYLSGDFAQASTYKTNLFYKMFQDVVKIEPSKEDVPNLKYTQAIVVEYNSHPTEMEIIKTRSRRGFSIWEFMNYQIEKGILIEIIDWILDHIVSLNEVNRRTLILTSKIEHCEYIYHHIMDRYKSHFVGMYHGEMDQNEMDYNKENADIIVATYSSFSTGIDTTFIKYVISTSASNRIEDNQASGRARRISEEEDCFFWMLVDTGFASLAGKEQSRIDYLYDLKVKEVHRIHYDAIK